jgi:integrase/recombinase XerD
MLVWYRAGINPQERLPFLATSLGHRDIHSTLVYLTACGNGPRTGAVGERG